MLLCFSKCIKYSFITVQLRSKVKFAYARRVFLQFFIDTVKCSATKVSFLETFDDVLIRLFPSQLTISILGQA